MDMPAPETIIPSQNEIKDTFSDYKDYLDFVQGDITALKADIIVNSSTGNFKPLVGVSKSIHNKCGTSLFNFLTKNYCGVLPGSFVESPNYKLKCKKILHVCGPDSSEDEYLLVTLYEQCLNYCFSHNYQSIIFPCISAGGRGIPEEKACNIAIETCKRWVEKYHEIWKGKITFCCYTNESLEVYKKYFKEILNL
jgi:O-acetyl-ADP-ribose deacetylase (regulator of RNase III)